MSQPHVAPYEEPLPAGVEYRYVGSVAHLRFTDPNLERAYLAVVGKGPGVHKSDYYLQNWPRHLGPAWNTLLDHLRYLAQHDPDPQPTIGDLAQAIGVSDQTVRRMLAFWQRPEWMDLPPAQWPQREWLRWIGVRGYLPLIEATGPNAPYRFRVLFGEVLHPHQRADLTRLLGLLQGELGLSWGDEEEPGAGACPTKMEGRESAPGTNRPPTAALPTIAESPPTPPHESAAATEKQQQGVQREYEVPETDERDESLLAAAALLEIGGGDDVCSELLGYPEGAFYVDLWVRQIGPTKPQWEDPGWQQAHRVGWVRVAVRQCCTNPKSSWYAQAQDFLAKRRELRHALEKAPPPVPLLVRRADPEPRPEPPPVPEELAPYWETLWEAANDNARDLLRDTASYPSGIAERRFKVVCPNSTLREFLNRQHAGPLGQALAAAHPEVDQVRFVGLLEPQAEPVREEAAP